MKYIRTKDEVYENNGLMQSNSTIEENSIIVCGGHFAIPISKIIRQADSLEDLFDEQIVEYKDKSGNVIRREFVNHIYDGKIPEGEPEYYGVIRTKMGLRYVAKEIEGEWKLI